MYLKNWQVTCAKLNLFFKSGERNILEKTTLKLSAHYFQWAISKLKTNSQINQPIVNLIPQTPFSDEFLYFYY